MFICDNCQGISKPRMPSHTIIVSTRPKRYPHRKHAHRAKRGYTHGRDDHGGVGTEIVSEMRVCGDCIRSGK